MKKIQQRYGKSKPSSPVQENDLDGIQTAICLMTQESLRATREMLRLCHESKDAGAATLAMLHQQGDQLSRSEAELNEMGVGLVEADENLIQIQRSENCWCGTCFRSCCPCGRGRKDMSSTNWNSKNPNPKIPSSNPHPTIQILPPGNSLPRVTTNKIKGDEMESNLHGVSDALRNMRKVANEMGSEITSHNSGIDRMNVKASSNQIRMKSAQGKANNILQT